MKYLFLLTFFFFFSFQSTYAQEALIVKENLVAVYFNSTLDISDLAEIKEELSKLDINLAYTTLSFQDNGQLQSISFKVDCNDGFKGSAGEAFLTKTNSIGFFRDYDQNANNPFGTGKPKSAK